MFYLPIANTKNQQGRYVPSTTYAWRPNFTPLKPKKAAKNEKIDAFFRRIGARFGNYSYIVRRKGMRKILEYFKAYDIFLPFDMDLPLVPGIRLYTVNNDVVSTQIKALSDNGGPNYQKSP